ncbi:MAG: hypothetical protein ACRC1F_03000 [Metamycoplasmataceae bacterium]
MMHCSFCEELRVPKFSQEQIIIGLMLFIIFCLPGLLYVLFIKKKTCRVCDMPMVINNKDLEDK